ncbi:MAG: hypothetical protein Q4B17_14600 [Lautropia sp.]|nr:hypothetical protein [Lautropia sp.]
MIRPILHTLITVHGPALHTSGHSVTRCQTHQHAVQAALTIADAMAGERLGITVNDRQQASVRVLNPENEPLIDDDVLIVLSVPEHQRLRVCSTSLQHLASLGENRAATVAHLLVGGLAQLRRDITPSEIHHAQ